MISYQLLSKAKDHYGGHIWIVYTSLKWNFKNQVITLKRQENPDIY